MGSNSNKSNLGTIRNSFIFTIYRFGFFAIIFYNYEDVLSLSELLEWSKTLQVIAFVFFTLLSMIAVGIINSFFYGYHITSKEITQPNSFIGNRVIQCADLKYYQTGRNRHSGRFVALFRESGRPMTVIRELQVGSKNYDRVVGWAKSRFINTSEINSKDSKIKRFDAEVVTADAKVDWFGVFFPKVDENNDRLTIQIRSDCKLNELFPPYAFFYSQDETFEARVEIKGDRLQFIVDGVDLSREGTSVELELGVCDDRSCKLYSNQYQW